MEYRPLEGFVFAVTPFNFTAIGGNLSGVARADGQHRASGSRRRPRRYSAYYTMRIFEEAGLPAGRDQPRLRPRRRDRRPGAREPGARRDPLHRLDRRVQRRCGRRSATNVGYYRNYPRIVGETGGKDFIVAHPTADVDALATAIVRGSFEYQGQKCSAASRVYAPSNLWPELRERLADAGRRDADGRRHRLLELHGRRDRRRRRSRRRRTAIDEARSAGRRDRRRRRLRRQRGLVRPARR